MKILQVIAYYPPAMSFGGPPQVFSDLGRELVRRGHRVTVYTTDVLNLDDWSDRVTETDEVYDGITVYRFRRSGTFGRLPTKYFKLYPAEIPAQFTSDISDYDVVHISEITHPLAVRYASLASRAGIPYAVSVFGNLTPDGGPVKQAVKRLFIDTIGRRVVREASALLVQTANEGEVCARYTAERHVRTVVLPVDMAPFSDLPPRGRFREKRGIGKNEKIILFLGRVHRNKGIQFLLRTAAPILRKDGDSRRLVIAGTDEGYRDTLAGMAKELGIEEKVVFTGGIFGSDKLEAYVDASVFAITPNAFEETSLAALEACACGTPVIVTERNAIPWLEEYGAGFQVNSGDRNGLEKALLKLLDDEEFRMKTGKNARKLIEEKYALERVVDSLETVFRDITGDSEEPVVKG